MAFALPGEVALDAGGRRRQVRCYQQRAGEGRAQARTAATALKTGWSESDWSPTTVDRNAQLTRRANRGRH